MHPLIICIGNDMRGDDGIGGEIGRQLADLGPASWDICEAEDDALALMDAWQDRDAVIIVDAIEGDGRPGQICRLDANSGPVSSILNDVTSHGLGLAHSIELARSLGRLPAQCIVFTVEGINFAIGANLSPEVEKAVPVAIGKITREADKLGSAQNMKRHAPGKDEHA